MATEAIIQVNFTALNNDILQLENRVASLESELELKKKELEEKKAFKKYAETYSLNGLVKNNVLTSGDIIIPAGLGITDFILQFLKRGRVDTNVIIKAYAEYTNSEYDDVANNISNALNRLKKAGDINSIQNEGGRRAGSKISLKQKE